MRRRRDVSTGDDIFEIILGDAYLMSSRFTAAEEALAHLGLAAVKGGGPLDVAVGGLGLGYTARSALEDKRVGSLLVVEALEPVIDWHKDGLLPVGRELTADGRTRFRLGDFFALSASGSGFDLDSDSRCFDAILLDIDHSPTNVLDPDNLAFYQPEGLRALAKHLKPVGVFALWSNDPPDEAFIATVSEVFTQVESHVVTFSSPLNDTEESNTVYVAHL